MRASIHFIDLSPFLSKLFNGTLMMQRDENGQIIKDSVIKFDLHGEFGVALELCKQTVPVVANECIVCALYFIRRLALALKENSVCCLADMKKVDWNSVKPFGGIYLGRLENQGRPFGWIFICSEDGSVYF